MDPFLYQYGIGSVIFAVGLAYAWRQGYLGLSGRGALRLLLMLAGLMFFMAVQGYLQYAPMDESAPAPAAPASERPSGGVVGAPVDYAVMLLYLVIVLLIGMIAGRRQKTLRDFFFGGQRFSWWLISFSLVATLVGSYSFVKYSNVAYRYGLSSSQTYLNDWFWMPLLVFGWIPILYFSRVHSIPEYFGRRFDGRVRLFATLALLVYLVSYVGVNLYTMGTVLHHLLGWDVLAAASLVAAVSALYVSFGGQTSVIMTDLFQGVMLLVTGIVLLALGAHHLGGFEALWEHLPRGHRTAFANFNEDPGFPSVGIFWQDAVANSAFFYFLNQGILMRFVATRSVGEARRAALSLPLVLMPIAACVVASGGWVGRALVHAGVLPEMDPASSFYLTAEFLARPGVFGLVLAALAAALMSTVDTLITAVSTVVVNDLYKPYFASDRDERHLLAAARVSAIGTTAVGICLVPVFAQFSTIYAAHGAMTAAVTPPLLVALLLALFWRRYTAQAALWTIGGGLAAIALSIFVPELIAPFAHGVPMRDVGDGLFAGARQFKFMRAFYGLGVSLAIGVGVSLCTRPEPLERQRGLVWGTVADAIRRYKGGAMGSEMESARVHSAVRLAAQTSEDAVVDGLPLARLSEGAARALGLQPGEPFYVSDTRWWLGGLRSSHLRLASVVAEEGCWVELDPDTHATVVAAGRESRRLYLQRFC